MELIEAIEGRRSIRKYQDTPVDEKTVELVLNAARLAPSWTNCQCWRFIVVRNASTKAALSDMVGENPAASAIRKAPVVIVVCAELGKSGYYDGVQASDQGDWYMFDVAIAMEHLVLAAHSLGLGTVHVGLHFDTKKAASILEIPPEFRAVEMTPLGYPDQEPRAKPRKELSEIVYYEKFGLK